MNVVNNMAFEYCSVSPLTMGHRKINSISKLSDGWNYGDGTKFSSKRVTDAEKIDNLFVQLLASPTDAFPGLAGQIMVTAYKDDYYIEYTLHNDDNFSVRADKAGATICRLNYVDQAKALSKLAWLAGQIWNTSELVNPRFHYDWHRNRINRFAFSGVADGGASIIDCQCIDTTRHNWCQHLKRHYSRHTFGHPYVFWQFADAQLPSGHQIDLDIPEKCHCSLTNVTDEQLGDLIEVVDPKDLWVCRNGTRTKATDSDIVEFAKLAKLETDKTA